jgi:long-chain acyl-CoA synthetase
MVATSLNKNENNSSEKSVQDECASIAEILDRAIALYPQRPALVIADRTWSYLELGNLIDAAVFRIKKIVPKEGSRIAIIGGNHLSYIVAYWSAQRLGCPTVETGRNESLKTVMDILSATHAQFVVTDRDDLKLAAQGKLPAELFDEFLPECEKANGTGLAYVPKTENILKNHSQEASIVYTSGTTASAKGVVLTQRNFCFIARAVADYLELTEEDRCALTLPLYHTYGKSVLLSAFAAGASVVVLDGFSRQQFFLTRLSEEKCTVLSVVPYHLHVLTKSGGLSRYNFSSLRAITSSANKLSPAVIDNLSETLPGTRIFSMYGLTEATTRVCYVPPELLHLKKGSCGRPLPRVEIRIATEDGNPAPTGAEGEILVRGPNIMKGYWGDADLTKTTIVDGWLKTRDIGHLDEDGFLYIDGRRKDIIKCAGERINPLEIEDVLMEHPDVEEAAVVGQQDSLMGETIHAYVTLRDLSLKARDLRDHCYARLSHHKVPHQYTIVDSFPRTSTGKIQKHILAREWPGPIEQSESIFKE